MDSVPRQGPYRSGQTDSRAYHHVGISEGPAVGIVPAYGIHYADYSLVRDNSRAGRNPVIRAFVDDDIVVLGIAGGLGYGGRDVSEIPYGVESGIRRNVPACLFPVQP